MYRLELSYKKFLKKTKQKKKNLYHAQNRIKEFQTQNKKKNKKKHTVP